MRESELKVLEQYEIDVTNTRKVREGVLCETSKGLFLLKELRVSEKRLDVLDTVCHHLKEQGYPNVDWILKTREGTLFSTSEDGIKYVVKRWFVGKECDIHREKDVLDGVRNLANVHLAFRGLYIDNVTTAEDMREEYFRHNREMKKVRSFMRNKPDKGEFELSFLKNFDAMYADADAALSLLNDSCYGDLFQKHKEEHILVHGDYNYHNILITYDGMATTNFEHVATNIQVTDFYYYLRKVMEKNRWNISLGDKMIECYQKYLPFQEGELTYIAISLAYPEKFWKVANSYSRSRKVWIPAKNLEKLELVIKQTEEKKVFLENLFSFHLT